MDAAEAEALVGLDTADDAIRDAGWNVPDLYADQRREARRVLARAVSDQRADALNDERGRRREAAIEADARLIAEHLLVQAQPINRKERAR